MDTALVDRHHPEEGSCLDIDLAGILFVGTAAEQLRAFEVLEVVCKRQVVVGGYSCSCVDRHWVVVHAPAVLPAEAVTSKNTHPYSDSLILKYKTGSVF